MASVTTACVCLIGNEILSGRTQDQNLSYLGKKLNECGIMLREARVIPDIPEAIIKTINDVRASYDYVFTTGGIGPTHDDITSQCIADAFGVPLVRDPEADRLLRDYYGAERTNDARMKMADIPQGASMIANPVSMAPGFVIDNVYVLAGVPSICQAMMDGIAADLKGGQPMRSLAFDVAKAEGDIADLLTRLQSEHEAVEIGVYPRFSKGRLTCHVVLRCCDEAELDQVFEKITQFIDVGDISAVTSD